MRIMYYGHGASTIPLTPTMRIMYYGHGAFTIPLTPTTRINTMGMAHLHGS